MKVPMKTIRLLLKPVFTRDKITSIKGQTILSIPSVPAGQCIVGMYTRFGSLPSQCYKDLVAQDESGSLKLAWQDIGEEKNVRQWRADRDTVGDIIICWEAFPRVVTSQTPPGPRTDTRTDEGGIESSTYDIAPIPWGESEAPTEIYRKIIEWDLGEALPGTRAVSAYGEGPEPLEKIGSLKDVLNIFFMVGPLKSHPPTSELAKVSYFGYYWFGENAPKQIVNLGPYLEGMFRHISSFFQDPPSETNGYRILVRSSLPAHAFGGQAGERNFLLEYDDTLPGMSPDSVMYLLSHEMVHNWPRLDSNPFSMAPDDLTGWFDEGIADFYGTVLPYRFKLASKTSYLAQMNALLSQYYTNPLRNITDKEAKERKFESASALEIPYKRGFTFFVYLDREIRHAAKGKSLDDLIVDISHRRIRKESHTLPVILNMINDVVPHMIQVFQNMQAGKLFVPPADSLGPDFELVAEPQEMFDLGFDEDSTRSRIVTGLSDKCRARDAGVMEGDEILRNTFLWECRENFEWQMTLKLKRDGKEFEISYWPRSYEKVESWQFREK